MKPVMDQLRDRTTRKDLIERDPQAAPGRSGGWLPWLVFLAVLAAAGAYWWQRPQSGEPLATQGRMAQPVSVGAAKIGTGNINVTLDALGTVTSLATVTVKTQVSGQLVEVDFKEGQEVKKGDLLARIDPRPYQAALAQAQGQLARDQALLQGAQIDLVRYQKLVAQKTTPQQTLDTQISLVGQYKGTVEADKAAVQAATVNLDFTSIRAPIDGRAGLRQVDEGNYVTPTDANGIVVITQIQPISVLFTVPEDKLQAITRRLHEGATLPVIALDRTGSNKLAQGRLETFDSQIDPTTGTIKLRASFANENRALYPNQFVNVELIVNEHKGVVIAPTAAIQRGVPGIFVYVINPDDTVSVRQVRLGVTEGERVEILAGLDPGERVIVDGADKLREGAKVSVRQEAKPLSAQPQQQQPGPGPAVLDPPTSSIAPSPDQGGKATGGGKHRHPAGGQRQ